MQQLAHRQCPLCTWRLSLPDSDLHCCLPSMAHNGVQGPGLARWVRDTGAQPGDIIALKREHGGRVMIQHAPAPASEQQRAGSSRAAAASAAAAAAAAIKAEGLADDSDLEDALRGLGGAEQPQAAAELPFEPRRTASVASALATPLPAGLPLQAATQRLPNGPFSVNVRQAEEMSALCSRCSLPAAARMAG